MIGVFHTTRQPMRGFVDKLSAMEGKDGVLSLSIAHGFPWSDIKEMGSKIIAITDGDRPKAEKLARELGREFFAMREATQPPYVTLDAAMARVSSHNLPKPMVLADVSDNAGGGAASDSTFMLKALLDKKVKDAAIGMIWDPGAVKLAFEVGEGAELDIRLGGKLGPQSGPPIDARAKVLKLAQGRRHRVRRRAQERRLDRRRRGAADRRRDGDRELKAHPVPQPRLLHQARRRSLDQEGRGGEVDAALPCRLRADRERSGLCRRPRRAGARLVAAALHQGRQGPVAVRRQPARNREAAWPVCACRLAAATAAATLRLRAIASPNGVQACSVCSAPSTGRGTWSLGARVGDFIFVAGVQGIRSDDNSLVAGSDEDRIRHAFVDIETLAESQGASLHDCDQVMDHVSDLPRYRALATRSRPNCGEALRRVR